MEVSIGKLVEDKSLPRAPSIYFSRNLHMGSPWIKPSYAFSHVSTIDLFIRYIGKRMYSPRVPLCRWLQQAYIYHLCKHC